MNETFDIAMNYHIKEMPMIMILVFWVYTQFLFLESLSKQIQNLTFQLETDLCL